MKSILVDIDHTLANAWWRDSMLDLSTWDEYHEASDRDEPLYDIVELIRRMRGPYNIVGITGRPEKFRSLTSQWCIRFDIPLDELLMRPDNTYFKAHETKLQLITKRFIRPTAEILFALEDRDDCCTMLRSLGITVLQVWGRRV